MTTRAADPFDNLNQTISGGIVLLGVMFLSLPVIVLGLGCSGWRGGSRGGGRARYRIGILGKVGRA